MKGLHWWLLVGSIAGCVAEGPSDFTSSGEGAFTTPVIGWLETRDGLQPVTVHEIDARHGVFEDLEQMRATKLDARLWPVDAAAPDGEAR